MSKNDVSTFAEAFDYYRGLPTSDPGGRKRRETGVVAGPTAAHYALAAWFGSDVTDVINSETKEVLASGIAALEGSNDPDRVYEIMAEGSKDELRNRFSEAVENRYSTDEIGVPFVGSPNYSCPAVLAVLAVSGGFGPPEVQEACEAALEGPAGLPAPEEEEE